MKKEIKQWFYCGIVVLIIWTLIDMTIKLVVG